MSDDGDIRAAPSMKLNLNPFQHISTNVRPKQMETEPYRHDAIDAHSDDETLDLAVKGPPSPPLSMDDLQPKKTKFAFIYVHASGSTFKIGVCRF
jgi:hypothetical protein